MNRKRTLANMIARLGILALTLTSSPVFSEDSRHAFKILTVESSTAVIESPIGGTVIPYKEVTLTAQAPGRVEYIAGEEGDILQMGQVLVTLDKNKLLAQRSAALSQLHDAQVAHYNANVQFMREMRSPRSNSFSKAPGGMGFPAMFDEMFSTPMSEMFGGYDEDANKMADFYQHKAMVDQAYNGIAQAQAQIVQIDATLRDTQSLAPFTGQIFKKHIEVGDTVQPGQPLITFSDITYFQIRADIPLKLIQSLKTGDVIKARIDTIDQPVKVKVARVFPGADNVHHTVTVKFNLPKDVIAPTGTYAEVHIPLAAGSGRSLPAIPASAVVHRSGLTMIFIVNGNNETDLRVVRLGQRTGDSVNLLAGIEPGERIIVNPTPGLVAGVKLDL